MVYSPRKVTYPMFIGIFSLAFFGLLFLIFFNQGLSVRDASVSVSGSNVVFKMFIDNNSGHVVNDISVSIQSAVGKNTYFIKSVKNPSKSSLSPGESYEFIASQPLSEALDYSVLISAPFNRDINLSFALQESTINPVRAEISIPSKLYLGEKYTYPVKLCNISGSELGGVIWVWQAEEGSFKEEPVERTADLSLNECKTIYAYFTPNKLGTVHVTFVLRIGTLEKKISKDIEVVQR
jgi:hypothetical protein